MAYVVCSGLGLETDAYSFGYVAAWSGGGDEAITAIRTAGARIQKAAQTVLDGVEAAEAAPPAAVAA